MGNGCTRASVAQADEPCDPYLERPDVHLLLARLRSERPDNLASWLPRFAASELTQGEETDEIAARLGLSSSSTGGLRRSKSAYDSFPAASVGKAARLLDWRYNIFDAERSVLKASREALRKDQRRSKSVASTDARLHSFLPQVIIGAIRDLRVRESDTMKVLTEAAVGSYNPIIQSFEAVVVFMDASGFTSLTEKLALQPNGAEEIGRCLNRFFSPLIQIIVDFGGDILKFSGDAVTILWPIRPRVAVSRAGDELAPPDPTCSQSSGTFRSWSPDAASAVVAACKCCLEVQSRVSSFGKTPVEGLSLTLHIGVGFGPLHLLQLGGLLNRWEYCAAGPPLEEVAVAEPLARSGETVVSPTVSDVLAKVDDSSAGFVFQATPEAPGYKRLVGFSSASKLPGMVGYGASLLGFGGSGGSPGSPRRMQPRLSATKLSVAPAAEEPPASDTNLAPLDLFLVERYVPRTILRMVTGDRMSDEMRRATIVFLSIGGLDPGRSVTDAGRIQVVARLLQRSTYALEGSLNKILVDDKGMLLLACFGLPPLNHYTDDPLRGILAAARFCDTLREEEISGKAGVATGMCWCGIVGSKLRREYTVLGDTVNLSARLMGSADEYECRVDHATWKACKGVLSFSQPKTITVKGKAKPLPFYLFTGKLAAKSVVKKLDSSLMNWEDWPAKLHVYAGLERLLQRRPGPCGVIFVKGPPGCGKTEVAAHVRTWAKARDFTLLSGQNMNSTATFAVQHQGWVEVFKQLMSAAAMDEYWHQRMDESGMAPADLSESSTFMWNLLTTMLTDVGCDDDLMAWAPMMNIVLSSLDFGSKEVQAMLERDEQHSNSRSRLGELCEKLVDSFASFGSSSQGTLILLHIKASTSFYQAEDEHSSRIAHAVAQLCNRKQHEPSAKPLIFVIVSRQDIVPDDGLITEARACGGLVEIDDLDHMATGDFLRSSLNNQELAPELIEYVHRASGGNPFAIQALCESMKEQGALTCTMGRSNLAPGWQDSTKLYQELRYPETMVGIALAQFEKLEPPEQHILKIASVFVNETSVDFNISFSALDLSESQGLSARDSVGIEEHCEHLKELGIFKEGAQSRRCSRVSSLASSSSRSDRDSNVADGDAMVGQHFFCFKSMLLRHVASGLVLRAQHNDILASMNQSRRASRLLTAGGAPRHTTLVPSLSGALAEGGKGWQPGAS